jgi:hypothetical protein
MGMMKMRQRRNVLDQWAYFCICWFSPECHERMYIPLLLIPSLLLACDLLFKSMYSAHTTLGNMLPFLSAFTSASPTALIHASFPCPLILELGVELISFSDARDVEAVPP